MKKTAKLFLLVGATALYTLPLTAVAAPTAVPNPPTLSAKGYVLMDYNTGEILVEKNANEKLNPASLTKLMTSYVAGQEIKQGNINSNDIVTISQKAWAKNFPDSSKMFIEVGSEVSMMDLLRGLIIQSGNDASVAIAEHVAGSEQAFVSLMNSWATKLAMNNSSFANPHGLDNDSLYTTPYDIALLGRALIHDLPTIYPLYSEKSFTYNNITQRNRNGLLNDNSMNVDGMKTGYTSGAGYSLVSSATDGDMRLISVVMGAKNTRTREAESKQLLNYGFRFYDTVVPHKANDEIITEKLWFGNKDQIKLGVAETSYVTLLRNDKKNLTASVELNGALEAPIAKGQEVGKVLYIVNGKEVSSQPLVALEAVDQGSFFSRLVDHIKRFFVGLFSKI